MIAKNSAYFCAFCVKTNSLWIYSWEFLSEGNGVFVGALNRSPEGATEFRQVWGFSLQNVKVLRFAFGHPRFPLFL